MNKYFVCLVAIIVLACQTEPGKAGKPAIVLDRDTINIGKVPIGDSARISIKVKNTGTDTLRINGIGYSCGCTDGRIERNIIPPHESGTILVKYKNTEDGDGIFKTVGIENNSEVPFKTVHIIGNTL